MATNSERAGDGDGDTPKIAAREDRCVETPSSSRAAPLVGVLPENTTPHEAVHLVAVMVREGLQDLTPYYSPDVGYVDPLDDGETRAAVRRFLHQLWQEATLIKVVPSERAGEGGR